jgi:hypothetical protein
MLLVASACGSGDSEFEVILDGLNEPRGLWVLADGALCAAEAGRLAEGQVVKEGPTSNLAETGSVTCVDTGGVRRRIIEQLPYVFYNVHGATIGPADVAEMGGELVADFLAFAIQTTEPDFFDEINIISNPFAMIPDDANDRFLVTDGATGHVLAAGLDGEIDVFSDVAGHEVLTGIARGPDGLVYVTSFSQLPHPTGGGAVLRLHPDGSFAVAADQLTTPIDLAFDTAGRLYVIEFIDGSDTGSPYQGKTGRLLRLEPEGDGWTGGRVLVERIPFPTALLIDGEDRIYISVHGAFSAPNSGLVLRFDDLVATTSTGPPIVFTEPSP